VAPVLLDDRPDADVSRRVGKGRDAPARHPGWPGRGDRRNVVVVVCDPRLCRGRARCSRRGSDRPDEPRDVRRPHPQTGDRPGTEAGRPDPGAAAARVLRRLGICRGRGRPEDGLAGARRCRTAPPQALHHPRRLPRRHLRRDERLRPRWRHARDVPGAGARQRLRPPTARRAGSVPGRPGDAGLGGIDSRTVRRARRGHRRGHPRAGAARGGWDARLQPARRPRAGRPGPRARGVGRLRRDRDRLLATGTRWALDRCGVVPDILCLGQGSDRWLPESRGRPDQRRTSPGRSTRARPAR